MKRLLCRVRESLRTKLILSHLAVALGATLILINVIAFAVQNYYISAQLKTLHASAENTAQYFAGNRWVIGNPFFPTQPLLVAVLPKGRQGWCKTSRYVLESACSDSKVKDALTQALQGQETDGRMDIATVNGSVSSLYVAIPITSDDQIIGSLLMTEAKQPPDQDLLQRLIQIILLVGLGVGLIVILFSALLTNQLTKPLRALTRAAEEMKQGKYTERVPAPESQDELGRLAQTFNEMASKIEADVNELRRQEKARRELLANIAHDLATPLTAIQGLSEAIADDMIPDTIERQETAQRIGREVQRLRRMVADLQQMTSLESGRTVLELAPLNMHTLVEETLAVIAPECEQMDITCSNRIPRSAPLVLADSDRIAQVLLNLLDNARRHTQSGGEISVEAVRVGKWLQVRIVDTGTGIDPADLPHIFERFYRADRSRTGATGGSGLGLSIVKAIIAAHNGSIQAESTPGRGTTITFTLQLADPTL